MKKEQIEKAAREFTDNLIAENHFDVNYEEDNYDAGRLNATDEVGFYAFTKGAQWRVKSVWHNSKDLPESNSDGRVKYSILVCFDLHEVSPMVVSENDMDLYAWKRDWYGEKIHWAYVKDLMP